MSFPFELDPTAWDHYKENDMEHGPERRTFQARRTPQPDRYSALDRRQSNTRRHTIDTGGRDRRVHIQRQGERVTHPFDDIRYPGWDRRALDRRGALLAEDYDIIENVERRGDNLGRRVAHTPSEWRRMNFGRRFDDERSTTGYVYSDILI